MLAHTFRKEVHISKEAQNQKHNTLNHPETHNALPFNTVLINRLRSRRSHKNKQYARSNLRRRHRDLVMLTRTNQLSSLGILHRGPLQTQRLPRCSNLNITNDLQPDRRRPDIANIQRPAHACADPKRRRANRLQHNRRQHVVDRGLRASVQIVATVAVEDVDCEGEACGAGRWGGL